MNLPEIQLGIIGCGMMARSIIKGLLAARLLKADQITVSDLSAEKLSQAAQDFGVATTQNNPEMVAAADVLLLAVKPQNMAAVLQEIRPAAAFDKLFLSIAAGVTASAIHDGLGRQGRVVRIMPNTPARVLASASALCRGPGATEEDIRAAQALFDAVGTTVVVEERLMDAVTGLSGSGPAYIFLIIEALADAGVRAGLPRATAISLAAQTCAGAAKLVLETGEHPGVLKDQVTSPGGTTINGMYRLEKKGVRGAIIDAVSAAVERSKELGE